MSISCFVMPWNRTVATTSTISGLVGAPCGAAVGAVGLDDGTLVGTCVGATLGPAVGDCDGARLGP